MPLAVILILQTVIVAASARNTAFQDEALYIYAGRQIFDELLGRPVIHQPWALQFTGLAYAHPLLSGIIDRYLGFEATRLLSLAWMLVATIAVYDLTRFLFDRESALFAAAAYAVQGPVLFLSGLTTHDAMTVGLLGVALLLATQTRGHRARVSAVAVGACLFLAMISLYGGSLFIPSVLALLGWQTRERAGLGSAIRIVGWALGTFVLLTAILYLTVPAFSASLIESTLARSIDVPVPRLDLAWLTIAGGGPFIVVVLAGFVLAVRRNWFIALLLFGTMFLAPVYHLYKEEPISLFKHLAYGSLFGAPLVGSALARLVRHPRLHAIGPLRNTSWIFGLAAIVLLFGHGLRQAQIQYALWPDSRGLVELLRTQIHPGTRILAEEAEVPRYYLREVTTVEQWDGLYFLEYRNQAGERLTDDAAYRAAIDDGYFDIIVLRFGFSVDRARAIAIEIEKSHRYQVLARIPFSLSIGDGAYTVWVKVDSSPEEP